jgi:hypothetical protein
LFVDINCHFRQTVSIVDLDVIVVYI